MSLLNFANKPFEVFRAWVRREVRCVLAELDLIAPEHVDAPQVLAGTPAPTPAPEPTPDAAPTNPNGPQPGALA